ncbi:hypothetical protein VTK56DRAFT_2307 [Thermocarpiscus australiensis]
MPTTHVEPGCGSLLQDIANSLWKARKVVVITGAGISTNSGIPDFRSENGLYSLIQAQFDAAQQQAAGSSSDNSDADVSDLSLQERPTKRRRVSRAGSDLALRQVTENNGRALEEPGEQAGILQHEGPSGTFPNRTFSGSSNGTSAENATSEPRQDMAMAGRKPNVPTSNFCRTPSPTPLPSPRLCPSHTEAGDANLQRSLAEQPADFVSSPPGLALNPLCFESKPNRGDLLTESSSPLSSPPPVMADPYQESLADTSTTSSSRDSESSGHESEEPSFTSTPLLSSQTSFASNRTSLPQMKGRDLFDAQIWSCPVKTSVFYTFVTTLRQKVRNAQPTSSHHFVSILRDSRKLVRCYTQNIDQLEERVGLTTSLSLGAGSRYRFSVKAGRNSGGARSSMKGVEGPAESSQEASQRDEEQQTEPQLQDKPHPSQTLVESGGTEGANGPAIGEESSLQSSSDPSPTPNGTSASTSSAMTPVSAPSAPNRGVECVFLHGSLAELRCFVCGRTASWDEEARQADTLAGRQPICPHCAGATAAREEKGKRAIGVGKLRPDIVLYGEEHPNAHLISPLIQHDLSLGPDMLLILGTSMRVHGLKVLVKEFAKAVHDRGGKVVFVNFTKPPDSVWSDIIDYWVQWDCDAWVGDLKRRKPALWLPPGATPPEEEKQKSAKPSRRQSGGETAKGKEGTLKSSRRCRESGGTIHVQRGEKQNPPAPEEGTTGNPRPHSDTGGMLQSLPTPPAARPRARPKRPAGVPRERKLNPDAKRPASIREHKLNGAYLVWKVLEDLRRITAGEPLPSTAPSPSAAISKPRAKKPRKSAPAVLETRGVRIEQNIVVQALSRGKQVVDLNPSPVRAPSPLPKKRDEPIISDRDSSISAAVKSRKRKRAVAWRMINGVETRIALNGEADYSSPLAHTDAVFRPSSLPAPECRILPRPIPSSAAQHFSRGQNHGRLQTGGEGIGSFMFDDGFRDTDRLIAKAHQEVLVSRPATPPLPVHLPPLRIGIPDQDQRTPPKLAPLEPKVFSPGPCAEISSNVGSPSPGWRPSSSSSSSTSRLANPFFFADPLAGYLEYPPLWQHHGREEDQGYASRLEEEPWCPNGPGPGPSPSPDEQLRKEQEAALMLSAMRRGSGSGGVGIGAGAGAVAGAVCGGWTAPLSCAG